MTDKLPADILEQNRWLRAVKQAERLRSQPMDSVERALFFHLENLYGKGQVLREVPIGPFIVDFYVPEAHVAYELDSWGHMLKKKRGKRSDVERDRELLRLADLSVVRVWRASIEQKEI